MMETKTKRTELLLRRRMNITLRGANLHGWRKSKSNNSSLSRANV